ncbi:MAG: phage major capsid protein, partial [Planctomycetes bacterium]|nr:phage major capsid protein [Planctomycetota bacterium]
DIDALFKKAQRQPVASLDAKSQAIETKANLEVAAWIGQPGDAAKGATYRAQYKAAFDKMVRRGEKALDLDETKTLSVGSAPDGGYYVDPARSDMIVTRLRETSAMRGIANVVSITAPSIKIPVDRDDVGYEWVGEQSTRNATTTPQVGELEIPVHEVSAMPKATQNMLDDAGFDIEGWLNGKIGDRFGRAENTAFVSGDGTSKPKGFLTGTPVTTADASRAFGVLQYIATGASGAFATPSATVSQADKLLDLIFAFNAGYRQSLRWAMNKTTLGAVRKFKDQNGNFIYDPRLNANGVIDMVLNYPVSEFADMADYTTANSFAIALGDFKRGYMIVDRQGMRQLRDPYTDKPRVLFYTTKRVGGAVVDSDAIKLLKFGTS